MKATLPAKTYKTKNGHVVVHLGTKFSMICFPDVKWSRKTIPAEWRN